MIRILSGLPDNVVGFEAVGEVLGSDYKDVLLPALDDALQNHEKIRLLYVLGAEFTGYSGGAMWQDTKLGFEHLRAWEKIAIVTDTGWVRDGVKAFGWMVPGDVDTFPTAERADAEDWVAA